MKHFFFLVFCIQNFVCTSQTFNGIIKYEASSLSAVEYASILNKNNQNYVFSDSMGKFSINAQVKDTLEISHLNAVKIKYVVGNKKSDTISVPENINSLKEVRITSQTNKKKKLGKTNLYGFGPGINNAIKINVDDIKPIKKIIFPVKFFNKRNNQASIKIQFVKSINTMPFLKPSIISVTEIRKDDEIVFDLTNQTADELKSDFFIFIETMIENRSYKKNEVLKAIPFFYSKVSIAEGNLYFVYKQKLISYSERSERKGKDIIYNLEF